MITGNHHDKDNGGCDNDDNKNYGNHYPNCDNDYSDH